MLLTLLPLSQLTNCHTFSDRSPRDVLYGRPLGPLRPKYVTDHLSISHTTKNPKSTPMHRPTVYYY